VGRSERADSLQGAGAVRQTGKRKAGLVTRLFVFAAVIANEIPIAFPELLSHQTHFRLWCDARPSSSFCRQMKS